MSTPVPTQLHLHKQSAELALHYGDSPEQQYRLPAELLRVYSPSAEVRGHGSGQEVLQTGKKYVNIQAIEATGNYAIQITFSDGHDTGIYSWDYLYELCTGQQQRWSDYLQRLQDAGASREPSTDPIIFKS